MRNLVALERWVDKVGTAAGALLNTLGIPRYVCSNSSRSVLAVAFFVADAIRTRRRISANGCTREFLAIQIMNEASACTAQPKFNSITIDWDL